MASRVGRAAKKIAKPSPNAIPSQHDETPAFLRAQTQLFRGQHMFFVAREEHIFGYSA